MKAAATHWSDPVRKPLLTGAVFLLAFLVVVVFVGLANARADPTLHSLDVPVPRWRSGVPSLRVALLSDIHIGNRAMDAVRLGRIVALVNAAKPDLVLIAGDFLAGHDSVSANKQVSALAAPLMGLRPPLGVVAVLGNHDYWGSPEAVRLVLAKAGITVLENQAARGGPLSIVGISDRFSGHDNVPIAVEAARPLGGIPIVLTHSPDVVPVLPRIFTVAFAGHTHCGQLVIPGYGPLITPRSPREHWWRLYDPHYRCGVVRDPGRLTVVTGGLGAGTVPMRLGAMLDWWLLKFHSDRILTSK